MKILNFSIQEKESGVSLKYHQIQPFEEIDSLYQSGFRQFHCCNTLPCDKGGISGPILIPHTKKFISYIKNKYSDVEVIAGGGISDVHILHF